MELDRVEKLVKLLNDANLSHLEIDDKQGHIVLEKNITVEPSQTVMPDLSSQISESSETTKTIKAPFVGTFNTSEQPDKASLVQPGDKIKVGQSVGIIEAMKMMNEVKFDQSGTIDKILVTNGDAVEYDQSLFTLKD